MHNSSGHLQNDSHSGGFDLGGQAGQWQLFDGGDGGGSQEHPRHFGQWQTVCLPDTLAVTSGQEQSHGSGTEGGAKNISCPHDVGTMYATQMTAAKIKKDFMITLNFFIFSGFCTQFV